MAEKDNRLLLEQAESSILGGDIRGAAQIISNLDMSNLSRGDCLACAKVLRRVGLADDCLRLLAPLVRPSDGSTPQSTDAERAEYAHALQRVGSAKEAAALLATVDERRAPEALLYRAIHRFSNWDYGGAIAPLRALTDQIPDSEYIGRVGRLNLAAALAVIGESDEADQLLSRLLAQTEEAGEYLLLSNALEVSSQKLILDGHFEPARACLDRAQLVLRGVKVLDFLWVVKWRAILDALSSRSEAPLEAARQEAARKGHWETLRDLDFYRLKLKFDRDVFLRLYFGSNSVHYRERLRRAFPEAEVPGTAAVGSGWTVTRAEDANYDLLLDPGEELAPGTMLHAVPVLFLSDWYRGFRIGELHAILFEGDHYNPLTSINRVHQALARLRKAMAQQIPGISIIAGGTTYSGQILDARLKIKIRESGLPPQPGRLRLASLQVRLGAQAEFAAADIARAFTLSKAGANNLLKEWREAGWIAVVRKENQRPIYRFVSK